jgi:flagellar motor switch protein FliG
VRLTIHEPIDTKGYSKENVVELMQRTQEKILSALSTDELPRAIPGVVETRREQRV